VQTRLNKFVTELDLAHVVAHRAYGNYLQGTDPLGLGRSIHSTLTQDSVILAIIIKRHRLLEYWYNTSVIYNVTPVLNSRGKLEIVPSIDQFWDHVACAFYARAGRGLEIPIKGTWEDCEGLFQEELPFIPAYMQPEL